MINDYPEPSRTKIPGPNVSIYVLLSILLLAAAALLRFHDLSQRSMWIDEAAAAIYSQGTIPQTIDNTRHHNTSPIIFPLILHAVQKFNRTATSVRLPSAIFSLLTVLVMLLMPRVGMDRRVAFLAATVLALSTSQVHWAQEAREYSLSVLLASLMIFGLFDFLNSESGKRKILYTSLFAAPLIQYGLILFGFAVIGTLALAGLLQRRPFIGDIVKSGIVMATSSVISIILTLRFQWQANANNHLSEYFYSGNLSDLNSLATFLVKNTYSLVKFMMLGKVVLWVFVIVLTIYACRFAYSFRGRFTIGLQSYYQLSLFLFAIAISIIAVLFHAYPYGAAHQCLYLAPTIALAFASASIAVADFLKDRQQTIWFFAILLIIIIFGTQTLRELNPYGEVEDIKSVLAYFKQEPQNQDDPVYVYPGAAPALHFYGISGERFVFGKLYPQFDREGYRKELGAAMDRGTGRLWIILSSVVPEVEDFVISAIPEDWHLEKKVDAAKASLFLATSTTNH
ncbi:MAG TPA: glycosyltransferase family 39 protein [Gammaproteobacteria bacterium]|nr:glycosyltransferase family 39 protein [Gammaproteobacteria bacterium]HJP39528.1 glycosyltransferase family 39 protein [Gammaproteobacteria bacterium]